MQPKWFLENWHPERTLNNHHQNDIRLMDFQPDGVVPPMPAPVQEIPLSIEMQCYQNASWQKPFQSDCPTP